MLSTVPSRSPDKGATIAQPSAVNEPPANRQAQRVARPVRDAQRGLARDCRDGTGHRHRGQVDEAEREEPEGESLGVPARGAQHRGGGEALRHAAQRARPLERHGAHGGAGGDWERPHAQRRTSQRDGRGDRAAPVAQQHRHPPDRSRDDAVHQAKARRAAIVRTGLHVVAAEDELVARRAARAEGRPTASRARPVGLAPADLVGDTFRDRLSRLVEDAWAQRRLTLLVKRPARASRAAGQQAATLDDALAAGIAVDAGTATPTYWSPSPSGDVAEVATPSRASRQTSVPKSLSSRTVRHSAPSSSLTPSSAAPSRATTVGCGSSFARAGVAATAVGTSAKMSSQRRVRIARVCLQARA